MSLNIPNSIPEYNASATEMIEECRRQSALASYTDREDTNSMNLLDQILLDAESNYASCRIGHEYGLSYFKASKKPVTRSTASS